MKKIVPFLVGAAALLGIATAAQAHVSIGVGIGIPGPVYAAPAYAAPVYAPPPVVYAPPPPVIYAPPPPVVYAPPVYYRPWYPHRHWHGGYYRRW